MRQDLAQNNVDMRTALEILSEAGRNRVIV